MRASPVGRLVRLTGRDSAIRDLGARPKTARRMRALRRGGLPDANVMSMDTWIKNHTNHGNNTYDGNDGNDI